MLRRLRTDYPADYSACVFDAKGKTFRDDWYPEYKAHRPPMPDDLRLQIEPLHEVVAAAGWNILMIDGVEADDVIGTLTHQASQNGARCIVSTGDKDLTQLVNPHVTLVNTMSNEVLDEAGVLAKFGVPPERIVDYLTLVGDTVDNVPGVAKCGPKTAVKWLTEYGTLDNLMAQCRRSRRRGRRESARRAGLAAAGPQTGHGEMRCGAGQEVRRTGRPGSGRREDARAVRALRLQELAARSLVTPLARSRERGWG